MLKRKFLDVQASEEQLPGSSEELRGINENLNSLVEERTQKLIAQNETLFTSLLNE